jgi:uridine kinase
MLKFYNKSSNFELVIKKILRSKLFWMGLLIKIFFGTFFVSKFLSDSFLPFVEFYSNSNFSNPYQHFFIEGKFNIFPYPNLMLWILTPLHYLIKPSNQFLALFIIRIPIIFADFLILIILFTWLKNNLTKLLIFYWLSPVLVYINYIHGQLDVIPISLLFASLYFLFKERPYISAIFLALALACKTNILLVLAFFIIFLISKKYKIHQLINFLAIFLLTFLAIISPFINSSEFLSMVFLNKEQNKIFDLSFKFNESLFLYFVLAGYLLLVMKALMIKNYNRDIFVMFLGFSFGVINLFIPPMQGWYYWIIPLFCYFFIKEKKAPSFLFIGLQISYFAFFAFNKNSDFFEVFQYIAPQFSISNNLYHLLSGFINPDQIASIFFTILQVFLSLNCIWIYREGINSYQKHKITCKPYLIGICGDSGVGKTSLVNNLINIFGSKNVSNICGDDNHKWERGHQQWQEFTHLNPAANKLHNEISFLTALKNNQEIKRSIYDHNNGKFSDPVSIKANKIIILEGLHSFYVEKVRKLFDLKIFIKPQEQLQLHWKIIRDFEKRSYSKEQVLQIIKTRQNDSQKFILPQEKFADIKIELFTQKTIENLGDKNEKIPLKIRFLFKNDINIEPLTEMLNAINSLNLIHNFCDNDEQLLEISGSISEIEIKKICEKLIDQDFNELNFNNPIWSKDLEGIIQLFLSFYIIQNEKISDEK